MKFLVQVSLTQEAGIAIENRQGGPGPVIGRVLERFKPEAVYMTTTERTLLMFVDLPGPADVAELMIAGAEIAGAYPKFTPVVSGKDFEGVVSKAIPAARSLTKN